METERFTAVSHFHFHPQPKFEYHFDGSTIKGFLERNFSASTFDFDSILEIWTPSNPPTREERYLLGTITARSPSSRLIIARDKISDATGSWLFPSSFEIIVVHGRTENVRPVLRRCLRCTRSENIS